MFNKQISAKEIYVFTEQCIEVQKYNIGLIEKDIQEIEKNIKKVKNSNDRKPLLQKKFQLTSAKNEANQKIEYLISTLSIILGVYEKNGKKINFKKNEKEKIAKKYDFLKDEKNGKE